MPATPPDDRRRAQRLFDEGFALHREGRSAEAWKRYEAVLAIDSRHAPALHYSALLLHGSGRSAEAIARVERSLDIDDRVSDVWTNAGLIYTALGRADAAARALERALEIEPSLGAAWSNLAALRLAMDEPVAAEAAARRAVERGAGPQAGFTLALALAAQSRAGEALEALDRVEASGSIDPTDVALPALRAQMLVASGRRDDAHAQLTRAIARADAPVLRIERARLADARRDHDAAIADYEAALRLAPDDEAALSELVFLKKRVASWDGLPALQAAFAARVAAHGRMRDGSALTPFSFLSDPSSRAGQRVAAEAWSRRFLERPRCDRPLNEGRLRIGYLSSDLHAHATGVLAVGLFERHDRSRFEVFAYSTGPDDGSALRQRLVAAFETFVDARGWPDARIAERIRADGIDVLVDLKGHTEQAPTGAAARRPAPIAVSYLGYPGTMGAPFVDYLIGDAVVTPLEHAADYAETLVLLPHTYQVTDDRREMAESPGRAVLGLPEDATVLCCFNQSYKIGAEVFAAWMDVLRRAPRAVLWLLARADDDAYRNRLRRAAVAHGVAPDRIVFATPRPHADYLALYRAADLSVDTWPYNAHTTASDALWAGCPVLTWAGETFASRVASSILFAAGLADCVSRDAADYVERAVAWANDPVLLRTLRDRVARQVRRSALFDTEKMARDLERAYVAMAAQYRAGRREAIVLDDVAS